MIVVVGLGNRLRGDDGIGPRIIEELKESGPDVPLTLVDAGADAFTVLEYLTGGHPLLIIDCARMGKEPGQVARIQIGDSNLQQAEGMVSLHGFGFAEVLAMARAVGPVAPCSVIGIEPKSTNMGEPLSAEVQACLPLVKKMIIEEAQKYAEQKNSDHR